MSNKYKGWHLDDENGENKKISMPRMVVGGQNYTLDSLLLKNRIIRLSTDVNGISANYINTLLLALDVTEDETETRDITMYIDSSGGNVVAGLGIYDTMHHVKSDVATVCVGMAASMASLLLMSGAAGKRYALPNSTIMIHELSHGFQGKLKETTNYRNYSDSLMKRLVGIYVTHAPKDENGYITRWGGDPHADSVDDIKPEKMDTEGAAEWLYKWMSHCDRFMNAEQALALGHIDKIIKTKGMPYRK